MSNITLYNGDCLKVMRESSFPQQVDVVFTSPPYNRKRNDKYDNYNDDIVDYFKFLCDVVDLCISKASKYVFFNIQATYYNRVDVYKLIGKYADVLQNIIIWEKSNPQPAPGNSIANAYEFFLVFGKESVKSNDDNTKNHITTSVYTENGTSIHRAVMKPEVANWFINKFTSVGDTVLDPFMGLGTTGIACKKFNRNFIGIEIDETYYKMAEKRIKTSPNSLF